MVLSVNETLPVHSEVREQEIEKKEEGDNKLMMG
jgi:hypothetical protein